MHRFLRTASRITRLAVVMSIAVVLCAGAVANAQTRARHTTHPGVFGTVATVNDGATTGCETSDTGSFTLTAWKSTSVYTVTVASPTTYVDPGVSGPTFATVCVGERVGAIGTVAGDAIDPAAKVFVAPESKPPANQGSLGTVATVNGGATSGCLGSDSSSFTLDTWRNTTSVTVTGASSTTYVNKAVLGTTYADLCVGDSVRVAGALSSGAIDPATDVTIAPASPPPGFFGTVATVNGGATSGCLDSDSTSFTLTGWQSDTVYTVTVASPTTYVDPADITPTYTDLCVGDLAGALGTVSSDAIDPATVVFVIPDTTPTPSASDGVLGTVATVNGGSTTGCLSSDTSSFTLDTWKNTTTVMVTVVATTAYVDTAATGTATYADVCVGDLVGVLGPVSDNAISSAIDVTVAPVTSTTTTTPTPFVFPTVSGSLGDVAGTLGTVDGGSGLGTVTSVNGGSTTGCLSSGTGSFTVVSAKNATTQTVTVTVVAGTVYADTAVSGATYADLCVGDSVRVVGTVGTGTIDPATIVSIAPADQAPTRVSQLEQLLGS